jgi:hypothetical protein
MFTPVLAYLSAQTISTTVAIAYPIVAILAVYLAQRSDETEKYSLGFGAAALLAAAASPFTHTGILFTLVVGLTAVGLLGYWFFLKRQATA